MGCCSLILIILVSIIRNERYVSRQFKIYNVYSFVLRLYRCCCMWSGFYATTDEKMKILLNPKGMSFDFIVPQISPSEGVQKIAGFSRGWHHKNSIRLGIRKENDYCVLYLYAYINGERVIKRICNVYEDIKLWATLTFRRRCLSVKIKFPGGNSFESWHHFTPKFTFPIGYQLYSYAEEDGSDKKIPIECNVKNIKIW